MSSRAMDLQGPSAHSSLHHDLASRSVSAIDAAEYTVLYVVITDGDYIGRREYGVRGLLSVCLPVYLSTA